MIRKNSLQLVAVGLASAVVGFWVQGCTTQPAPECNVTSAPLSPYAVLLTKTGGSCAPLDDLNFLQFGVQRYHTQAVGGSFTLGLRVSRQAEQFYGVNDYGNAYSLNTDTSNDCSNPDAPLGCELCVTNGRFVDGGSATDDGGLPWPIIGDDGGVVLLADGGVQTVDLENACEVVLENPPRGDEENDPMGTSLTMIGQMPQFPTKDTCVVSGFDGGVQTWSEVVGIGGATLPQETVKVGFTKFNILTNAKVPGTYITGSIDYTEGSCSDQFDFIAFWPQVGCSTDSDCDPCAHPDQGIYFGSGMNPYFKPVCDTDLGICKPTVTLADLENPAALGVTCESKDGG